MKKQLMIALLSIAPALGVVAQDKLYKDEFPLGDITLLDGPLKHARDLNVEVLLKYDCDRMLAPYRKEAGLQPRKPSYPNWDGLDGHVGGHYLSALAINAATGNEECRKRMEYMISELQLVLDANNQRPEAWCHNYIGGVPNSAKMWTAFSKASNPQSIGFSGILLAKRQNSFYCTYFLHNRNVADTKSPYPIKRLEVIRWFNQKSMVFNQSLS